VPSEIFASAAAFVRSVVLAAVVEFVLGIEVPTLAEATRAVGSLGVLLPFLLVLALAAVVRSAARSSSSITSKSSSDLTIFAPAFLPLSSAFAFFFGILSGADGL
jgi:hypothetical protein